MQYIIELGRNIELSVAEIISLYGEDSLVSIHSEFLIVDVADDVDISVLGGAVAVYQVHETFEGFVEDSDLVNLVVNNFGAKNVGFKSNFLSHKIVDDTLRKAKKKLKSEGKSVRFLENTKTAAILGAGFNKGKVDVFGLYRFGGKIYFSTLHGVQDINSYSKRDFDKPYRDAKLGMLPPKLAQTMINLAGKGKVYDPFCGTGTVLMEAALQDRDFVGSDIQEVNIEGAKHNLYWLKDEFGLNYVDVDVFVSDARQSECTDFDVIVTEGYLGEPKEGYENAGDLRKEMNFLEDLYVDTFTNFANIKNEPFVAVFSVPVFAFKNEQIYMEKLVEKLEPLGYSVSALIPKGNKLELEGQETFLYKRKDQKVFRKIFRLMFIPR